jgi:transposase
MFDELWLCNAQPVKNVPGRKSDLSDAEWLADVAAHGMVRPSFVPPPEIRELRELTCYRKTQVDARAREIQRLEKVLQDAGIKLTSVASAVWSVSSREIIEALISGTADPAVLAQMAKGRMRGKIDRLEEALSGHFGAHHAVVCRQIIDHIDFLDHSIAALTEEVTTRLVPFEAAVTIVTSVPGISRRTAEVIVAETGADMSRFPTPGSALCLGGLSHDERLTAAPRGRIPKNATAKQRMSRRLRTKAGRADYARRKAIVEPAFGQIEGPHAGHLRLRGLDGAQGEWTLHLVCHNLRKLSNAGRSATIATA